MSVPVLDTSSFPILDKFASKHNLRRKVLKDSCGESVIIIGKPPKPRPEDCSHIFEHGEGKLGISLLFNSARTWATAKARCLAVGMELHQDGETEGTFLFDPENEVQARVAKKETKAQKAKVELTPEEHTRRVELGKRLARDRADKVKNS
jgi:hypothetical protein